MAGHPRVPAIKMFWSRTLDIKEELLSEECRPRVPQPRFGYVRIGDFTNDSTRLRGLEKGQNRQQKKNHHRIRRMLVLHKRLILHQLT